MIHRILCPTNFTSVDNNAITYACHLAKEAGAKLTILHVQKGEGILVGDADPVHSVDEVESQLREECKKLSSLHRIDCTCEVEPPIQNFNEWVAHRSNFFDLLVMGSSGAETVDQVLFGSDAFKVIQKVHIPVMVIPEEFSYKPITRIVYAYDYKSKKLPPIEQLQAFASLFDTQVCFLTIVKKYSDEVEDEMDHLFSAIEAQWKDSHKLTFDYVYYPDVVESLNHFYQLWSDNDLMVLSARHHSFIYESFQKSVLKEITRMALYPVLVIQE